MTPGASRTIPDGVLTALGLLCVFVMGCGADDGRAVFEQRALPVLEARCASPVCHGVLPDAAARGEVLVDEAFVLSIGTGGHVRDVDAAYFAARRIINTVEEPDFSSLLRHPLPVAWGGLAHGGGDNFTSPADPGYRALVEWIEAETQGGEDPPEEPSSHAAAYFAAEVQPALVARSCAQANCHGPTSFVPFRFDPGLPGDRGVPRFSRAMTEQNRAAALGMVALDGDPAQSRLLRKALPLLSGGIRHRGGNRALLAGPDDPAVEAVLQWIELERNELPGVASEVPAGRPDLVFVRSPELPAGLLDYDRFLPGAELLRLHEDGATTTLSPALPCEDGDLRDPAASPDATQMVFALRCSEAEPMRLYVFDLQTGAVRRLADGPTRLPSGHVPYDLQPVWGIDGHVYFVSNRHDVRAEQSAALDLDIYRVPATGGEPERLTFTPGPEMEPTIFGVGEFRDYLVFSVRRAVGAVDETVGFSFPLDRHIDYHVFFGITPEAGVLHHFRELPDGRAVAIAMDHAAMPEGGALVVVDRNLGPDLPPGTPAGAASLPAFTPTLSPLDVAATPDGRGARYRDPAALPDDAVVAAWAPSPGGDFALVRVTLDETPGGCIDAACGPRIGEREVLLDTPGLHDHSPVPLSPRRRRIEPHFAINPTDPTLFSMIDVVVNDAVMAALPPHGRRPFRDDVRAVRLVEALPQRPDDWGPLPDDAVPGAAARASTTTLGVHMPARVLAELPVEDDASIYAEVPANTPFRTQLLDERGMSVGVQHNRWLFAWPGQHFRQSTHRALYDQTCGGCHGSSDGDPLRVVQPPDVTTRATLTLARFEDRNPRLPREPLRVGEHTAVSVDFVHDVAPILSAGCADSGCHDTGSTSGGLVLQGVPTTHFDTAYESLLQPGLGSGGGRRFVDELHAQARTSALIETILGEELDAPAPLHVHPEASLGGPELEMLIRWIETGAHYDLR